MTADGGDTAPAAPSARARGADARLRARAVIDPLPRAGTFYARSWQRWLGRAPGSSIPRSRPTLAMAGHALVDEAVIAGFKLLRPGRSPEHLARVAGEAEAAAAMYAARGWVADPASFHRDPPALDRVTSRPARTRSLRYERWSFDSLYEPHDGEPGAGRWLGYESNRRVRVSVLRHDAPRPWLVCVHGAGMGRAATDLALFRARWLHEDLGLNVALPVLPLHGPRNRGVARAARFPSDDVLDNVHGFAQAAWDVRRLLTRLRADGVPVGLSGISLGGYVSALVAGLDGDLACAILGVPLVDLMDAFDRNAPADAPPEWRRTMAAARRIDPVVSPLALAPRIPHDRRFIYAGVADRLVHPKRQVERIWSHWERPAIVWYPGGHGGVFRSKPVGRFVRAALEQSGLTEARGGGRRPAPVTEGARTVR